MPWVQVMAKTKIDLLIVVAIAVADVLLRQFEKSRRGK